MNGLVTLTDIRTSAAATEYGLTLPYYGGVSTLEAIWEELSQWNLRIEGGTDCQLHILFSAPLWLEVDGRTKEEVKVYSLANPDSHITFDQDCHNAEQIEFSSEKEGHLDVTFTGHGGWSFCLTFTDPNLAA